MSLPKTFQPDEMPDNEAPQTAKEDQNSSHDPSASSNEWSAVTFERGYYVRDGLFIKRSLRPSEYGTSLNGKLYIPRLGKERLQNEAESLRLIRRVSNIPVPTLYGAFEVDGAYFVITKYIDGVSMSDLSEDQKKVVHVELNQHIATLHAIRSNTIGGPLEIVIPPYRVMDSTENDTWTLQPSASEEYVFCHNDLSQPNIIVDPDTLKINAIIDWEYAGFFPECFEGHF